MRELTSDPVVVYEKTNRLGLARIGIEPPCMTGIQRYLHAYLPAVFLSGDSPP